MRAPVVEAGFGLSDAVTYTRLANGTAIGVRAFDKAHKSVVAAVAGAKDSYVSVTPLSKTKQWVAVYAAIAGRQGNGGRLGSGRTYKDLAPG